MTTATARAIDALASRAFPVLCRVLALAAAVSFLAASGRLVTLLANFRIG